MRLGYYNMADNEIKLLEELERLKLLEAGAKSNPLGQGKNLDALVRAAQDAEALTPAEQLQKTIRTIPDNPDFRVKGKPFTKEFSQVTEGGKDLVKRAPTDLIEDALSKAAKDNTDLVKHIPTDVFETTAKTVAPDFMSKLKAGLKVGGKAALKGAKYALPPVAAVAELYGMEEAGEGSDIVEGQPYRNPFTGEAISQGSDPSKFVRPPESDSKPSITPEIKEEKSSIEKTKKKSGKDLQKLVSQLPKKQKDIEKTDDPLERARKADALFGLLDSIKESLSLYSAANATEGSRTLRKPIQTSSSKSEFFNKELAKRKIDKVDLKKFQQSDYMTKDGVPVIFDPNSGKYFNPTTNQLVDSNSIVRKVKKTLTDPKTGLTYIRNSAGDLISLQGEAQEKSALSTEQLNTDKLQKIHDTYRKLTPKAEDHMTKLRGNFESETKDQRTSHAKIKALTDVQIDLATENEVAAAQLGAAVATIFENGRLTDEDVVRYTKRKSVVSRLQDLTEELSNGTILPEKAKEIKETLEIYKDALNKNISDRAMEKASALSPIANIQPEDLAPLIYGKFEKSKEAQPEPSTAPHGDQVTKDGKNYKWNPVVGKYQLFN